ncbi:tropomyosin, partial [Salmonella sp. s51228]|uniref:tropomyosin n=1 Tax=Salmonella sp. s51228 TaxID=3159652 RepID=UPI0039813449
MTEVKNEEATKAQSNAEQEVGNLSRRLQLEDDELERAQTRVEELTKKLEEIEVISDENQRTRKVLENRSISDDDKINELETSLRDAKHTSEESDRKYGEANR